MIIIEVGGGLGNQMFGYAFARSLSLKHNDKMYISHRRLINDSLREYGLQNFILNSDIKHVNDHKIINTIYNIRYYTAAVLNKLKIKSRLDNVLSIHDTLWERKYVDIPYNKHFVNIYRGVFQSSLYFDDIRQVLIEEFKTANKLNLNECELEKNIMESESVCLHVRRGDFLKYSRHNVCSVEYFNKAIKLMQEKKKDCKFFVFSDDKKWTKENIICDNATYVEGVSSDYIELHLMSKCKNFIIPNSTFSWWAQYLSENEDKVVIAPDRWLNDEGVKENGIYMDNWTCINPD